MRIIQAYSHTSLDVSHLIVRIIKRSKGVNKVKRHCIRRTGGDIS